MLYFQNILVFIFFDEVIKIFNYITRTKKYNNVLAVNNHEFKIVDWSL